MPTLNKYVESSDKNGYYIRANVDAVHPVTLQVTSVAQEILRDNGYRDSSMVPTKLVWSMYDVGLLYTESSLSVEAPRSEDVSLLIEYTGESTLSEKTRRMLIRYLISYTGPREAAVQELLSTLMSGAERADNNRLTSSEANRSTQSASYNSSAPWREDCPYCSKDIQTSEEALVQHWAHSSRCGFNEDNPKRVDQLNTDWRTLVRRVKEERENYDGEGDPGRVCPFCETKVDHRSVDAYLSHWTNGSCETKIDTLPSNRPSNVPVDIWWDIKERWHSGTPQETSKTRSDKGGTLKSLVSSIFDYFE